ncbi:hypothetical protein ACFWTE_12180 [Nocardiopsis sp. NPDC058631]|uniref:hypothetical protein n=1 Tax=Nocardiopsis sp. NPDC058631 TaxID=3346566 RepID=UPI0036604A6F
MRNYSAAFLSLAMGHLKALLLPARGRHSAAARRRSTRVRRYAPVSAPAPEQVSASLPEPPAPAPRPAPPSAPFPAENGPLVRPYFFARELERERELERDRIQAEATVRLRAWVPGPRPSGDLLATPTTTGPARPEAHPNLVRTWRAQRLQQPREPQNLPHPHRARHRSGATA